MRVTRLRIDNLRRLSAVDIEPGPGLNLITGDNGAGKTSLLEALHLMAYGRSFRGRVRDGLVRTGAEAVEVYLEWLPGAGRPPQRAGLRHSGASWQARLDGATIQQLGDLCAAVAVVTFEPGSHALVGGGAEPRRRFMDWGLFHVEPEFLPVWRRYARALRQRNALLKQAARVSEIEAWERELVAAGEPMTALRRRYVDGLDPAFRATAGRIAPSLGESSIQFLPGWKADELSLADALLLARERDRTLGHTTVGPHRADWRPSFSALPAGEALSRGQGKLAALGCLLAQAADLGARRGSWPVVALDDLASELDAAHRGRVIAMLRESGAQAFITGTEVPPGFPEGATAGTRMFHVEQGAVHPC